MIIVAVLVVLFGYVGEHIGSGGGLVLGALVGFFCGIAIEEKVNQKVEHLDFLITLFLLLVGVGYFIVTEWR